MASAYLFGRPAPLAYSSDDVNERWKAGVTRTKKNAARGRILLVIGMLSRQRTPTTSYILTNKLVIK